MIGTMIPYGVYAPLSCQNFTESPSTLPASSNPTSTSCICALSCAEEMKCSRRSSTHLTSASSRRAAVAAKLGMPLAKVECIAPDVGGGFGVKIMHPWPEEVLIPWAARRLDGEVKWVGDRREHFISSA